MKTRIRLLDFNRIFRTVSVLAICLTGCSSSQSDIEALSLRYLDPLFGSKTLMDMSNPSLLSVKTDIVSNKPSSVSRILVTPEFLSCPISVNQMVQINRNHRLTGVSFMIRSMAATCKIQFMIRPIEPSSNEYVYVKPIDLVQKTWTRIDLEFNDFTHSATFLHLNIDSFNPVYWDKIGFILIFLESPDENFFVDWGPMDLVHQRNRYRFF